MGEAGRVFLRVVEAGSLKAAAEQLGTTPSTVSRQLAALEERLGVKLVQRSTRRSKPTDAGARYYEGLRRLADETSALEAEIAESSDTPRGRLSITAPVDFGARFVVPVVEAMIRDAPDLDVELVLGSGFYDLTERNIDVAIRIGRLADSSLVVKRLGRVPRVLVASPKYLARRGTPCAPAELAGHEFVFYARGNPGVPLELEDESGTVHHVRMKGRLTVNSITAIRRLVENGAGIHLGPRWAFEEGLACGRLRALLPGYRLPAPPLHAVYAPSAYVPAKIRVFVDRMAEFAPTQPTLR